jgi:hypothetical protein
MKRAQQAPDGAGLPPAVQRILGPPGHPVTFAERWFGGRTTSDRETASSHLGEAVWWSSGRAQADATAVPPS